MNELGWGFGPLSPDVLKALSDPPGVAAVTGAPPRLRGSLAPEPPPPLPVQAPSAVVGPRDPCTIDRPPAHLEEEHRRLFAAIAEAEVTEDLARQRELEETREERDRAIAALLLRPALNGGNAD